SPLIDGAAPAPFGAVPFAAALINSGSACAATAASSQMAMDHMEEGERVGEDTTPTLRQMRGNSRNGKRTLQPKKKGAGFPKPAPFTHTLKMSSYFATSVSVTTTLVTRFFGAG